MAGKFSVTDTSAQIIAANPLRGEVTVQNYSASTAAFNLGFGQTAVDDEGIRLEPGDAVTITGHLARGPIYAVTAADTAAGGWQ